MSILPINLVSASNSRMTIDLSKNTGPIKYGATGWLYGLGNEGIPSDNMISALKPQITGQKPANGLQHPNGDAMEIAEQFKRAGGKQIFINIQDIYKEWPYQKLGMADYLDKLEMVVKSILEDPNRELFVYNPINEPDWIWYGVSGEKNTEMFHDWKLIYEKIRSLDPTGKIAGPSLSYYDATFYKEFMAFAKENNCVPDIMTWHELDGSFFHAWDEHFNHYRSIEKDLGINPLPISINEYGRNNIDIPVPGFLVQYIAKFENSKVDGSLAYWTTAGSLNDLVAAGTNNKPTGAWWLFKWYGEMTGHTVQVTPPDWNVNGLQGVASIDTEKEEAKVIFGGSSGDSDIIIKGLVPEEGYENIAHAVVWEVDSTGQGPSSGPVFKQEGNYPIINGQIAIPVQDMKQTAAYQMVITPNNALIAASNNMNHYEAEYADLSGSAKVQSKHTGYSGTSYVSGYENSKNALTKFVVYADQDGYYNVGLKYSAGQVSKAEDNRIVKMSVNQSITTDLILSGTSDWDTWNQVNTKVFLHAGINIIEYKAHSNDNSDAIYVDFIEVSPSKYSINSYEAEATENTLSGNAVIEGVNNASGKKIAGWIGAGKENYLQFNNIDVPVSGTYKMIVTYANGELGDGATNYNSNIVDRYANISTNGDKAQKVYFRNTLGWDKFSTTVVEVKLSAGKNTIQFYNDSANFAPNIDKIQIASPLVNTNLVANEIKELNSPTKTDKQLTLPKVPVGFSVAIKSVSPKGVIDLDGNIKAPDNETNVSVVLEVTNTSDGTTAETPEISVTVLPENTTNNNDAFLKSIEINGQPLDGFKPTITSYEVELPLNSSKPEVQALAKDPNAQIKLSQVTELPGKASVNVTAENGKTLESYTIHFKVPPLAVNTYLSDMYWVSATSGWATVQKDKSLDGNPITLKTAEGNKVFQKGLGANTDSEIIYHIDGLGFEKFTFTPGRDQDTAGHNGKIHFEVFLDGVSAFKLENVDNDTICEPVTINVAGKKELKLIMKATEDGNAYDHGDWADAKLIAASTPVVPTVNSKTIAEGITSLETPERDAMSLALPTVPEGYEIELTSTDTPYVIDLNGSIIPPMANTTVGLVFKITNILDQTSAETGIVDVTVLKGEAEQGANVHQIAKQITGMTSPAKDAKSIMIPMVPTGYMVSIKSSSVAGVIQPSGNIKPPLVDTPVTLVLTVKSSKDGTKANTTPIEVVVPAKTSMQANSDASLESISINGVAIDGFDATNTSYTQVLPFGSTIVPEVRATTNDGNAMVETIEAEALPGITKLIVTAQDGVTKKEYIVKFSVAESAVDTYLSDIDWISATTGWATVQKNKSLDGNPITIKTADGIRVFEKGLGANAPSEIVYDIKGKGFNTLAFTAGKDQEVKSSGGKMDFEVFLDGVSVYKLEGVDGSTVSEQATIDVTGVSELKLVMGTTSDGPAYDHGDWADARLLVK